MNLFFPQNYGPCVLTAHTCFPDEMSPGVRLHIFACFPLLSKHTTTVSKHAPKKKSFIGDVALFYCPKNILFLGCFENTNSDKSL